MKYQLLQIINGVENIIYESDKAYEIKRRYNIDGMQRIRIDGKMLLIFQAFDWAQDRPIREYKPPKQQVNKYKKVNLVDNDGNILKQYDTMKSAMKDNGYKSFYVIANSCNRGVATKRGHFFQWG